MRHIAVDVEVDASVAVVWELIADIRRWAEWGTTVRRAESSASRVAPGVRGRVQTPLGLWLPFEITQVDEGRSWTWRVAGVPATGHRVVPLSPAACRLEFTVAWPLTLYAPALWVAVRRIRRLAEAEAH